MRKIKFRGYGVNDTAWAYGDLVHMKGDSGAIETFIQDDGVPLLVDPESVGQLTGIRDKKGRCIYEGDIVRHDENGKCYAIAYDTEVPQFCFADNSDLFKKITVGGKQGELLDFVKLCQEVANKANEVVQIIDSAGKDAMSMAYATMEDGIGEAMLDNLRDKIDAYGRTPEGRKYFYGDHAK